MRAAALVAALALLCTGSALAREVRGAPAGDFDLYVLSLTWSPGFCASGGERKAPDQCSSGAGFLVHGLWPQYERGYPTECVPAGRAPLRSDFGAVEGIMPSEGLARYEWRKHGTCSGLPPVRYFSAVAAARALVTIPDGFPGDRDADVDPRTIERSFAAANRGLRPDMMAIDCARSDEGGMVLREVRICLTKDLRQFRQCPMEVERGGCRSRAIAIPAQGR